MVVEPTLDDAARGAGAETLAVLQEFRVGLGRAAAVCDVEASERTDAIDAVGVADRPVERRLEVGVGQRGFADVGRVIVGLHLVGDDGAVGADEAQVSVVQPQRAIRPDQAAVHRREVRERFDFVGEVPDNGLPESERALHDRHSRGQIGQRLLSRLRIQRGVDAAGHRPRRVNTLPCEPLDHLLAELAQRYPVPKRVRLLLEKPGHVALGRIGIHAKQEVRRRQVEERERMRLHELGHVEQFAQLGRGGRDPHGHDRVAGLGRGEEVADRADAADSRRDRRHLVVGPALDELLEAADLGHVELRVNHLTGVVELDRYPGVTFDARDVVDRDLLRS